MMIAPGIVLPEAEIAEICRHQVRELSLFGSAARGEMHSDSDIDFIGMTDELSDLLGRKVDLGVLAEAHVIYAA